MTMGSDAEWAMVIVTGVSAYFIWRQLRADHERSRRQLAVTLGQDWTIGQKLELSAIVALVARLSLEQCSALERIEPFSLEKNQVNCKAVKRCLEFKYNNFVIKKIISDGKINLDGDHVVFIQFHTFYYLNFVESILAACNSGIADKSILEDQFRFLLLSGVDLGTYRDAAKQQDGGIDGYPSISNFLREIYPKVAGPTSVVVK